MILQNNDKKGFSSGGGVLCPDQPSKFAQKSKKDEHAAMIERSAVRVR
jgi:hypothetical protein